MKKILISIKPKWVAKILNGEKTFEIRKTAPKCKLPCEVYIYCTKGKDMVCFRPNFGGYACVPNRYGNGYFNGKVVAKFTLEKTYLLTQEKRGYCAWAGMGCFEFVKDACITQEELNDYLKGKDGYAWLISDLVIFDKPKELKDFKKVANKRTFTNLPWLEPSQKLVFKSLAPLTHAPQSWCYCEVDE